MHVAEVKRRELPALDDEFAKDLGEFETLGALRDRIHQDLRESREQAARAELRRSVLGALVERTRVRRCRPAPRDGQLERRLRLARAAAPRRAFRTTCCTRRSSAGARSGVRPPSAR